MGLIEHREPMIRAIRAALDEHEYEHANNDGRALAAVLAVEPLIADQLRGAVEALRALTLAAEGVLNDAEGQPRRVLREAIRAARTPPRGTVANIEHPEARSIVRKRASQDPVGVAHDLVDTRLEVESLRDQLAGAVEERDRLKEENGQLRVRFKALQILDDLADVAE